MGGDQLAAAVKGLNPHLAVVLMTGFGELMNAAGECPAGVDVVVGKPVTREPLASALETALRRAAEKRALVPVA